MIYNTMPMTSKDMALPMPEAIILTYSPDLNAMLDLAHLHKVVDYFPY
jgi:hypothetical protein